MKSLNDAIAMAAKFFADEPAALEVEVTMVFGQVWIGRDLQAFDHPRFAN